MSDAPHLDKRCGSCARFVRVVEKIDENGEVKRHGECLLMVWPAPLYDTNTCSQYVKRGTFTAKPQAPVKRVTRSLPSPRSPQSPAVPTVVVLDRFGKLVWKHTGLAKADEIRAHVRLL